MSVLSAPLKNDVAMQKDIFRLAAAIYSESNDVVSDAEIQLQIIKCMFVATGNDYLTKSEIISKLLEIYKYHISEDEVDNILRKTKGVFQAITKDDEKAVCLTQSAYSECEEAQKNNIDSFIDAFITEKEIANPEKCKSAIHVYLYELTTTNINSYRVLLAGKDGTQFSSSELSVDVSCLSDAEKQLVHDFLAWDNIAKNAALGNLVYCCLEYCLLINGDSPNSLLKGFIRRREIYLDTNVIFRALGINGVSRQNVVTTFLRKCKQAKLKLLISHSTRTEFFDTIGYYVSQMEYYPRGDIYSGAYEEIADYSIFAFYENWRQEHSQMSLKYFVAHIKSLYLKLIKDFGIEDDVKIPGTIYHSGEFKDVRNRYSASIKSVKQGIKADYLADDYHYSNRDSHDATVVRYIELLREKSADKDIFLASSDRALRLWDMNRLDGEYPVVVYPSQLFLILLKTCGRSDNDYDSFVSFINIRPSSKRVSPENAHIILSGISSITEDISAQEHLVEAVFSDDFQNVIKNSTSDMDLYEKVQRISQNYLDEELRKKDATIVALQADVSRYGIEGKALQDKIDEKDTALTESNRTIQRQDEEIKQKQGRILSHAERKTQPKYIAKTYVIPVLLALLVLAFVLFILLQFIYKDEKWNFAVAFFDWTKATYFGTYVGDYIYAIDLALAAIVGWLLKKWMVNPFNKELNELRKMELVQRYIKDNHLD
ncbi:hypothetical protein [Flavonifractor sp. An10]|uniref:hypothetical protein n=1 Tax=Flavonifractor sp. An10 TaxID=1965537 RepID=UPI000B37E09F|nr:hypothetical protein [Flavonifractor sp. An10]OUQ83223.1 hypothetical protein B5E42_06520 [Flavonifractor sp. An10]